MKADLLLSRLRKVRKSGLGEWVACCPAHEDRSPSLAVKQADDGRVLVHCFAGCSVADIAGAAGVSLADLAPDSLVDTRVRPLPFSPSTALKALAFNAQIVALAASDLAQGRSLTVAEKDKLFDIAQEFNAVVSHVR